MNDNESSAIKAKFDLLFEYLPPEEIRSMLEKLDAVLEQEVETDEEIMAQLERVDSVMAPYVLRAVKTQIPKLRKRLSEWPTA